MNQKIATGVGTVIIIIIAITAGIFVWLYEKDRPIGDGQVIQNLPVNKKSNSASTENWQTYKNDEYGFEFKYPKDWGEIQAKVESMDDISKEELNLEDQDKISQISMPRTILSFSNEEGANIQVLKYVKNKPYDLYCYEGSCSLSNIIQEKKEIENKSDLVVNGIKGRIKNDRLPPGNALIKIYTFILSDFKMEMNFWVDVGSVDSNINKQIGWDDITKINSKINSVSEIQKFITEFNQLVNSIKFQKK